jgi:hypothetical protein
MFVIFKDVFQSRLGVKTQQNMSLNRSFIILKNFCLFLRLFIQNGRRRA